jgi:predicted negative regulator of RcsB-dependent stress response
LFEHYGDILYRLGRKEDALIQWKQAKANGEDNPKLIEKINAGVMQD